MGSQSSRSDPLDFRGATITFTNRLHLLAFALLPDMERELEEQKQEYEDLATKYNLLEEDYVVIKARLTMEKDAINR